MSCAASLAVRPSRKTVLSRTTQRLMRGPGGCVRSKRLMAIGLSPWCREGSSVPQRRPQGKRSLPVDQRLEVFDDAPVGDVCAEGDERLVADDTKCVRLVRWQGDRDARFKGHNPLLAREPRLAAALEHGQYLDIGMRVQPRPITRRGGLNAGADRHASTVVVADYRLIGGAAGERYSRSLGVADDSERIGECIGHGDLHGELWDNYDRR